MTLFSSRPPFRAEGAKDASVRNDDPEPWVAWGVRYPEKIGSTYFEPRPEYNRPQHNPTIPSWLVVTLSVHDKPPNRKARGKVFCP